MQNMVQERTRKHLGDTSDLANQPFVKPYNVNKLFN